MDELIKLTNALYKVTGLFPTKEPLKFAIRKEALDVVFFCITLDKQVLSSDIIQKENLIQKTLDRLNLLTTYFEIAKEQNWIDKRNFLVLENEYSLIKEELGQEFLKILADKKNQVSEKTVTQNKINEKKSEPKKETKSEPAIIAKPEVVATQTERPKQTPTAESPVLEKSFDEIDYEKLTSIQLKVLELLQSNGQLKPNEINKYFPNLTARSIRRELKGLKERHIIGVIGAGKTTSYKINLAA